MNEKDYLEIEGNIPNLKSLKDETILVTGATGLIGTGLVRFLLYINDKHNLNIKVIATGRDLKKLSKTFFKEKNSKNLFLETIDLEEKLLKIFEKLQPSYVIHAASGADPKSFSERPVDVMKGNFLGAFNLLEAANKQKVRNFLFISSGEVYGDLDQELIPFDEDMVGLVNFNDNRACYPESKRATETLCHSFSKQYSQKVTIARPSHIFGPLFTQSDSRVSADFFRKILNNENIVMNTEGLQFRSYTYISDCISGLLTILINGENSEVYNVTKTDNGIYLKDFAQKIADIGNTKLIRNYNKAEKSMANASYSNDKLKKLGWFPLVSIDDGILRTFNYLKGED